jgi:hypothetical protein
VTWCLMAGNKCDWHQEEQTMPYRLNEETGLVLMRTYLSTLNALFAGVLFSCRKTPCLSTYTHCSIARADHALPPQ